MRSHGPQLTSLSGSSGFKLAALSDTQMGETEERSPDGVRYYRLSEVEEQNTFKSTWIIIHNKIYDVTKFLEEVRKTFLSTADIKLHVEINQNRK